MSQWHAWYTSAFWVRRRRLQLLHEPLCRECRKRGKLTPARIADHIEPHRGDYNKFALGKLQSLCKDCHDSLKQTIEHRGYDPAIGPDGFPLDQAHPVYGSGSEAPVAPARNGVGRPLQRLPKLPADFTGDDLDAEDQQIAADARRERLDRERNNRT